jgi:hypothetical protein
MKKVLIYGAPLLLAALFSCRKLLTILRDGITPQRGALLRADGPGGTYELIDSVLGGTAEEVPDCSHPAFGRHIAEIWDSTLRCYVFAFYIHVTPDNDRCVAFDRQRNEIKTYGPSPDSLKGFYGDTLTHIWKFRLDSGFQASPNFCHIHQIKAGDGDDGAPIITLTPRYGTPDKMQVIHTGSSSATSLGTVLSVPLAPFKGTWVKAEEHIVYKSAGFYSLTIRRMSDDSVLLNYSNTNIDMWRDSTTYVRPKWGIYRSLDSKSYLRDEIVRFNDFYILKGSYGSL